ncbi:MAG TPA: Sec-independent protein translocase protein TatB [Pyrinomonadaceae bacterium]|jgi:Tat protein translocase TatB subunit|nr:Sec-independent protein translocase protein TatB [Pyrinomonadaceae bacterium]
MFLAFLESIGTSELLLILVVALIIFGPRKLPQLSRQLGKSLSEFKRASEDFKRTWEKEVEMEKFEEEGRTVRAMLQDDASAIKDTDEKSRALEATIASEDWHPASDQTLQQTVARSDSNEAAREPAAIQTETAAPETPSKRDWL